MFYIKYIGWEGCMKTADNLNSLTFILLLETWFHVTICQLVHDE